MIRWTKARSVAASFRIAASSAASRPRACLRYAARSAGAGVLMPLPSAQFIAKQAAV